MTAVRENAPIVITMGDPSGVGPEVTVKALAALAPAERAGFAIVGDRAVLRRAIAAIGADLELHDPGQAPPNGLALIEVPVEGLPETVRRPQPALRRGGVPVHPHRGRARAGRQGGGDRHRPDQQGGAERGRPSLRRPHRPARAPDRQPLLLDAARLGAAERHPRLDARLARHRDRRARRPSGCSRPSAPATGTCSGWGSPPRGSPWRASIRIAARTASSAPRTTSRSPRASPPPAPRASTSPARSRPTPSITGPINGAFDLVVAQYHDQGHIPIKLVAFDTAVNVSLGPADRPVLGGSRHRLRHRGHRQGEPRQHALRPRIRPAVGEEPARGRGRLAGRLR